MMNIDISILTIVNKDDIYSKYLEKGLRNQNKITYEVIKINNKDNKYNGAREAFKEYINCSKGKILVFIHPDLLLLDNSALYKIKEYLINNEQYGVVGIAGRSPDKKGILYSNMYHGVKKELAGTIIDKEKEVMTVDECMFAIRKDRIDDVVFSNEPGWHLYAVELCINCIRNGYHNYVLPIKAWHLSNGNSLDSSYPIYLRKYLKNNKDIKLVSTTVRNWHNNWAVRNIYLPYYYVKQRVKKYLKNDITLSKSFI